MGAWVWSGQVALAVGGAFFALLFLPTFAWQYRRYGASSARRLLGLAAVSLYLTALASYTWLPLPPRSLAWCAAHPPQAPNLQPLRFVTDIAAAVASLGWGRVARSHVLWQVLLNVVLFVPWGVLVRRYLHRPIWVATLTGFSASVFIELTQLTGLWFIYPCAYRYADVDDVIANTSGALLGAVIAPLLLFWMPRHADLAGRRLEPRPITSWRRWAGMAVDAASYWVLTVLLSAPGGIVLSLLDADPQGRAMRAVDLGSALLAWLLVFVAPAWRVGGSFGMTTVWLVPVWPDGRGGWGPGSRARRLLRSSVVSVPWVAGQVMGGPAWLADGAGLLGGLLAAASVVAVPFTRTRRGLSGVIAGDTLLDARDPAAPPGATLFVR